MIKTLSNSIAALKAVTNPHFVIEHFTSGHCAELALAIYNVCQDTDEEPSIVVIYRKCMDGEEVFEHVLSHVVTVIDNVRYDIMGVSFDADWESNFEEVDEYGMTNDWEYETISGCSPDEAKNALLTICNNHIVPLNDSSVLQIEQLLKEKKPFTFY